jgi:two-component system OmpR family response regulator
MRILVVEDEANIAEALATGLRAEGFDVDIADNGTDGLWRAREGGYAAIILDILLPGMNGYRVCRTLREEDVWTPILMLTAKDGELDEAEALDTGADDFLSKPFSFVVLVARLRALLRRGATPRPTVLTIGTLTLDPASRQCTRKGTTIELTAREYALLELLMRRSDAIVSKTVLLDEVWGPDFEGDPNIVEVYIGYVRKKIDAPFGLQTILTVRGAGYRLVADEEPDAEIDPAAAASG